MMCRPSENVVPVELFLNNDRYCASNKQAGGGGACSGCPDQRAGHHRTSLHAGEHEEIVSRTATMRSLTEADLIVADKRASKYGANTAVADIGACSKTRWVTR